jgi:Spx/MgsR family transcriptional regulator
MIEVYGIKNCDSVKKALKFFKEHELEFRLHDFKTDPISCDKITSWLEDVEMKKLFNTRSTTYRTLKLKEKNLTQEGLKEWLCRENLLIKRPVIEFRGDTIVGFNDDEYRGTFL